MLFVGGIDDDGHYSGTTRGYNVFQSLAHCWISLFKQGMINKVNMLHYKSLGLEDFGFLDYFLINTKQCLCYFMGIIFAE